MLCALCVVLFIGITTQAWETEYTITGREEGEECHRQGGDVWTCKKDSECEVLQDVLKMKGRLKTCSWNGRSPVLCCPPTKNLERIKMTKSEEKCAEYAQNLCNEEDVLELASLAQPAGSLQRAKRQTSDRPDQGKTQEEPIPVLDIAGGRLTQTGEFPSMVRARRQQGFKPFVAGGRLARPRDNPHMALIGYGNSDSINWQCGGSLVSENFVLSAAHCVNTPYGLARWVRVGDLDYKTDLDEALPHQLEIIERVVHPGYRPPAFYNDIALFRLNRSVVFNRFVRPACLHTDTRDPTGVGTAAGWGKTEASGPRSSALMQVDISFVPAGQCKSLVGLVEKYLPEGVNTQTMVCAGELGKDTCQGDSGGPLILPASPLSTRDCLARLVGVTSFGPKFCGATAVPGAYVRVAHFVTWIESVVWPK